MRKLLLLNTFTAALLLSFTMAQAQTAAGPDSLRLTVSADRADHIYSLGDSARFSVDVRPALGRDEEMTLEYSLSLDGADRIAQGRLVTRGGRIDLAGSLDRPGFLRLDLTLAAGPDTLQTACGCGFDPYAIRPTGVLPADFDRFWRNGRAELLRVPMDPRLEEVDQNEIPGAKRYKLSLVVNDGTRISGWLTVPPGNGPFPAAVYAPYAGVYNPDYRTIMAREGLVTLALEIHGLELGREQEYYRYQENGVLDAYRGFGADDPYRFYYRRAVLGVIRAIDYLCSRPDVDSSRIGITGGSQGGGLSLITAGLDSRIKAVVANVPVMCDHTGRFHGRPSGWPNIFQYADRARIERTCGYFDAALIAGFIQVPARIGVGFIDPYCAPTTVFAAYNNVRGPKRIDCHTLVGHGATEGWYEDSIRWLARQLEASGKKP